MRHWIGWIAGVISLLFAGAGAAEPPTHFFRLADGTSVPLKWLADEMVAEAAEPTSAEALGQLLAVPAAPSPRASLRAASRDGRRFVLKRAASLSLDQWLAQAQKWKAEGKVRAVYPAFLHEPSGARVTMNDELMVCVRGEEGLARLSAATGRFQLTLIERDPWDRRILRVRIDNAEPFAAFEVAEALRRSGEVLWAEPNFEVELRRAFLPNDPSFGLLWHLHNTGQSNGRPDADVDAVEAWDITLGSPSIRIAIVDDGMLIDHPDLQNNIWNNPGEIPGNARDDDANGLVDDVTGWDFYANDNNPRPDSLSDYHSTPCAGLAAADINNWEGVAGVAPRCKIVPCRVLGEFNPTLSQVSQAIRYAGANADVLSFSWTTLPNDTIGASILYAATSGRGGNGCVVCAATGNEGTTTSIGYPASHSAALGIGASTNRDVRAGYSNHATGYGVFLLAPSGDSDFTNPVYTVSPIGGYTWFSGTSAATPEAAGAAAMVLSVAPNLTRQEVADALRTSCDKIDPAAAGYDVNGYSATHGYGRLNVHRALVAVLPDCAAVTLDFQPDVVPRGGVLSFSGSVRNLGGAVCGPCWLEFWLSNKASFGSLDLIACDSVLMPDLPPGGEFRLDTVNGQLLAAVGDGYYRMGIVLDRPNTYREVSESNNTLYRADRLLQVGVGSTQVDLVVENLDFRPQAVLARERLFLTGRVANRGTQLSRGVWVEFWGSKSPTGASLDHFLCLSIQIGSLGPGEVFDLSTLNRTIYSPAEGLPSGYYRVGVVVDRLAEQVETNDANNRAFRLDKWLAVGAAGAKAWESYR